MSVFPPCVTDFFFARHHKLPSTGKQAVDVKNSVTAYIVNSFLFAPQSGRVVVESKK